MAMIQVNINDALRAHMDQLVEGGHYESIAEIVRAGLRKVLIAERLLMVGKTLVMNGPNLVPSVGLGEPVPPGMVQGKTRLRPVRQPKPKGSPVYDQWRDAKGKVDWGQVRQRDDAAHTSGSGPCTMYQRNYGCTFCVPRFGEPTGIPE